MDNYNVLLATLESAPSVLSSAASIMWDWHSLIRGECLSGKHFNQPPDGPYGSWYGHYKVPLEDPFLLGELPGPNRDFKLRPIPRIVMKQIRNILGSYPRGVFIDDFRSELRKRGVILDKNLYGYKSFFRFLLSMPNVLEIQRQDDGHLLVRGVSFKAHDSFDTLPRRAIDLAQKTGCQHSMEASKINSDSLSAGEEELKLSTYQETKKRESIESVQQNVQNGKSNSAILRKDEKEPIVQQVIKTVGEHTSTDQLYPKIKQDYVEVSNLEGQSGSSAIVEEATKDFPLETEHHDLHGEGFWAKLRKFWMGNGAGNLKPSANSKIGNNKQLFHDDANISTKGSNERQDLPSSTASSKSFESASKAKRSVVGEDLKYEKSRSIYYRILNWLGFREDTVCSSKHGDRTNGTQRFVGVSSHEIFSKDSFWNSLKSFINSARGSALVSRATARREMAQNLLKEGPSELKSLNYDDALAMVDTLISDKKWIKESSSSTFPFSVSQSIKDGSNLGHSQATNGLRSIFMSTHLHSSNQGQAERNEEKKSVNVTGNVVTVTTREKRSQEKARSEIISDCRELLSQILKQHPGGYNMGSFRRDFLEKYGYHLEIQKLGYRKLQSLLTIFPEVRIESCYIIPSSMSPEDHNQHSDLDVKLFSRTERDDESDTDFEELGPVSNLPGEDELQRARGGKIEKTTKTGLPPYGPSPSEDELSDSEEETPVRQIEMKEKQENNGEDSSLLQILDSWYKSKGGDDDLGKAVGEKKSSPSDDLRIFNETSTRSQAKIAPWSYSNKQKPSRTYNFVSDSDSDSKEKLIEGILGSMKKSSQSR